MNDMVLRNSFDARAARARCLRFRRRILDISQQVGALHIGSAYSCTEIVDCIYYGLMRRLPTAKSPDTFVMSKGHGCMIQYVILEEMGVLSRRDRWALARLRLAQGRRQPDCAPQRPPAIRDHLVFARGYRDRDLSAVAAPPHQG